MTLIYQYSNYFLDATDKILYLYEDIVAEGDEALDLAFELAPLRDWKRLEELPPLKTYHEIDIEDYSYPY